VGATSGLCVSVNVAEGVTGDGVNVNVTVVVTVSLGIGVIDGVVEGCNTPVAAGAQAFKRRIIANREKFFIVRLVEYQLPASNF
jgi:hypothetical protein